MPSLYTSNLSVPTGLSAYYDANYMRVPRGRELEEESSDAIASLLNPPDMFPDTNRRAAEVTAARGIGGSAAAFGTGLRMTDEERIRRIALGEQLLSGAYARNPALDPQYFGMTPAQQAGIDARWGAINRGQGFGGGGGGYPGSSGIAPRSGGVMNSPWSPGVSPQDLGFANWYGTRPSEPADVFVPGGGYPDPSGALLPLYPGAGGGGLDYDWSGILGAGDYSGGFSGTGGLAGFENLDSNADFNGLLDYFAGE